MSQKYIEKLNIQPTECACENCQMMCRAPCCGSVEDFEKIIDAGYADKLMFDNLPSVFDGGYLLKPALKGHEAQQSPWATFSEDGCTFWNADRRCDLHELGLKPTQGKIAIHNNPVNYYDQFAQISKEDWESTRGKELIKRWKKLVGYEE